MFNREIFTRFWPGSSRRPRAGAAGGVVFILAVLPAMFLVGQVLGGASANSPQSFAGPTPDDIAERSGLLQRASRAASLATTTTTTTAPPPTTTTTTAPPPTTTTTTAPPPPPPPPPPTTVAAPPPAPATLGNSETGKASWYDYHAGTCAHKTLPKGLILKVTNLDNGKSTTCRIADRGPYIAGRIVDLERGVFNQIAHTSQGVISVKIEW